MEIWESNREALSHTWCENPQTRYVEEKFYTNRGQGAAEGLEKHQRDLDPTDCTADIRQAARGIPRAVHASPTHPRPPCGWLPVDCESESLKVTSKHVPRVGWLGGAGRRNANLSSKYNPRESKWEAGGTRSGVAGSRGAIAS